MFSKILLAPFRFVGGILLAPFRLAAGILKTVKTIVLFILRIPGKIIGGTFVVLRIILAPIVALLPGLAKEMMKPSTREVHGKKWGTRKKIKG